MAVLIFLLNLSGATMLLLFAVRMVQTGIERSIGQNFKRIITTHSNSHIRMGLVGVMLALVLQSATAASLLTAGFLASALISFSGGLAVVLGADIGSALVIQLLSIRPDWLIPVLLTVGGYLFLKTETRSVRQAGRVLLGIALILLALRLISASVDPIRESSFLPAVSFYLERDFIVAFIVGAVIAFAMHSSVAAILMCVTFVSIGILSTQVGLAVVLGANLGSSVLLIWLSRGMSPVARRLPYANLLLRGTGSVLALLFVTYIPVLSWMRGLPDGQVLVLTHVLFNLTVFILSLPLLKPLGNLMATALPDNNAMDTEGQLKAPSALDLTVLNKPALAIASLTRETLRMSETVLAMSMPIMDLYENGDKTAIKAVRAMDHDVNKALDGIRRYVADMPQENMSKDLVRRVRDLGEYAINLEAAGDVVSKNLMVLASAKRRQRLEFSPEGQQELIALHDRVLANMALAFNVVVSEDIESARLLMAEKSSVAAAERNSRKWHLKRLREGSTRSFDTSDIHLETLRALKDLNSRISSIAYPILYRNGQLLETRLVENVEEHESESQGPAFG
ncbi:Na/Pi cotransporter family protein [Maritalea sp.]|jgi:phosphate:Na+ symporter|uniref:Na/Pi cotransporter family protein n=1 Tax=Maritalea sp. TaxID=2003361 RepID=UPI0039E59F2E